MIVLGDKACTSYSNQEIVRGVDIPVEFRQYYEKHGFVSYSSESDIQVDKRLLTIPNSLAINNVEMWFGEECNYHCKYCCFDGIKDRISLPMSTHAMYYTHDKLRYITEHLKFNCLMFAGGEPTIHVDTLIEMDKIADELKLPNFFYFKITTNGSMIDRIEKVFKNTKRIRFIISVHDNKDVELLLPEWIRLKNKYSNSKFFGRLSLSQLVPPSISTHKHNLLQVNELSTMYNIIRPMYKEEREWVLDDVDYLFDKYPEVARGLYNSYNYRFLMGNLTGCLNEMIYEHYTSDTKSVILSNCILEDTRDGKLDMNNKYETLSYMRDRAWDRLTKRKLLLSHCGCNYKNENEFNHAYKYDAFLNTLCLRMHIENKTLDSAFKIKSYFYKMFKKSLEVELPNKRVPVGIEICYDFLQGRRLSVNIRTILSVSSILHFKVQNIVTDTLVSDINWSIENDCWLDADGEKLYITSRRNIHRYNDKDLLAVRYKINDNMDLISFWLIGRKEDIVGVINGEVHGYSQVNNKYFVAYKEGEYA